MSASISHSRGCHSLYVEITVGLAEMPDDLLKERKNSRELSIGLRTPYLSRASGRDAVEKSLSLGCNMQEVMRKSLPRCFRRIPRSVGY